MSTYTLLHVQSAIADAHANVDALVDERASTKKDHENSYNRVVENGNGVRCGDDAEDTFSASG